MPGPADSLSQPVGVEGGAVSIRAAGECGYKCSLPCPGSGKIDWATLERLSKCVSSYQASEGQRMPSLAYLKKWSNSMGNWKSIIIIKKSKLLTHTQQGEVFSERVIMLSR